MSLAEVPLACSQEPPVDGLFNFACAEKGEQCRIPAFSCECVKEKERESNYERSEERGIGWLANGKQQAVMLW